MDTKEFKKAINLLVKEKGISEEVIYEAMKLALTSAYKKNYHSLSNVRIDINENTGNISVYSFKTVVPDNYEELEEWNLLDEQENNEEEEKEPFIFDERIHIPLTEARTIVPNIEVGETIEEEVTPKDFGRVAAATAKQVVIQKIREAERNSIAEAFGDKQDELVSGTVEMEDSRNYYSDLGNTQGILPKDETIPGEKIVMGSNIKVYITKVDNGSKGCTILLSRCHYGFVKRLFELEIPEVNDGTILVHSVARDAGNRTKVAVESTNERVDAIGSCIGEKGMRIANILKELNGEKVDLVLYSNNPSTFIINALSPAKNVHVFITDEKKKEALCVTDKENLSLAIGKKGMNIKLAARLTHYKIDVKTFEEAKEMEINIYDEN